MTQIATVDKRATSTTTNQRQRKRRFKFGYWYPQRGVNPRNPIRNYELHHAPDTLDLKLITTRWMTYVVVAMLAIWVLAIVFLLPASMNSINNFSYLPDAWYTIWTNIGWAFIAITFVDRFIYDFICLISGINRISKEVNGGNWELISLTDVNVDHIVNAKHAFVQTRAWRAMSIVMGLRLGIVLVGIAHGLLGLIITEDESSNLRAVIASIFEEPDVAIFIITLFFTSLLAIYFYVIEPRWRLRVITAASLSVSSRIRSTTSGLLYGLGTLIAFWISQIFVFGVVFTTLSFIFPIISEWGNIVNFNEVYFLGIGIVLLFSVAFTAFIGYITYHDMVDYWLSNASRRLITLQGGSEPRRYHPTRAFMIVFGLVVGIWAFFAFWAMFFEANRGGDYYYYGSTGVFGFVVNDVYALGLAVIFMGLFLSLGLQVVLDFITLLSMKRNNRYVQYTTGRTRVAREVNIVMALRLGVICTVLLHFILGLKMGDQLSVVNVMYSFVLAVIMFIFAIFEMQWNVTTMRQIGHVIETRFTWRSIQILTIYGVVFLRWVLYGAILLAVAYLLAQLPFLRIASDDRNTRVLSFLFPTVTITGGMIFGAHILIQAGVRRLRLRS